ncbi:MAG: hypothetical protein HQK50_18380 [Oligoflexia bacterium]|nr:hypothetical protein [Oligoflexia bacterium]
MNSIIAIPVFRDMVAPRFDFSEKLLIIKIAEEDFVKEMISTRDASIDEKISILKRCSVKKLICHGVKATEVELLNQAQIEVIFMVTGYVDDVVKAYKNGNLKMMSIEANCCCKRRRRRYRHKHDEN